LLKEFAIELDIGCPWFVDRSQLVSNHWIIRRGKQLADMIFDIVAETDLNFEMQRRFAHDVEKYCLGFVIIFDPSDLRLVEFQQPSVQLLEKIVYVARLPVEAEKRLGAGFARVDDVVENLVDRGNLQPNLRGVSNRHVQKATQKNAKYRLGVTLIFTRGGQCRPFRRVEGI
jgi:hypothetical protein